MIENSSSWHTDVLGGICGLLQGYASSKDLSNADLEACFKIGCIGAVSNLEPLQKDSLKLVSDLLKVDSNLCINVTENHLMAFVALLENRDSQIHEPAVRFVSCCFALDNCNHLIERAINCDVFQHF